jgi:hypothetical protein
MLLGLARLQISMWALLMALPVALQLATAVKLVPLVPPHLMLVGDALAATETPTSSIVFVAVNPVRSRLRLPLEAEKELAADVWNVT